MIVVLTGGTGGAKLIQGLAHEIKVADLVIVCNTADDFVHHGLYISPDIDTITYTLAGIGDTEKGWGIKDDTFSVLEQLARLGGATWFKLGDRDLATHITRTRLLAEGLTLTQVTHQIRKSLGVEATILPMSDERVETRVTTPQGEISFQEYFVRERWAREVTHVYFAGIDKSRQAPGVLEAIERASAVIVCPSNPVTSIGPILAVPGIRNALKQTSATVLGVSPIIGDAAVTGPAHKLMVAKGWDASAFGVASCYADFLDIFLLATEDGNFTGEIEASGPRAVTTSIRMTSLEDKRRLAREVLALIEK